MTAQSRQQHGAIGPDVIEPLVVSLLAVNGYSLERVAALLPNLRSEQLTDPTAVIAIAAEDIGPLIVRVARSGYDRGLRTEVFTRRLLALMKVIDEGALDGLPALVSAKREDEVTKLLLAVPGIGPRVAANAWERLTCARR